MRRLSAGFIAGLAVVLLLAVPSAHAFLITFDFNALSDGASNSSVQTYMRNLITATPGAPAGATVTVTGAVAEKNYTGDNHVVGPVSGSTVTAETLGTSDGGVHHNGALDAFIINNSSSTTITMTFNFAIHSLMFDYEIFPDGTCPTSPCPGNWPDFTFKADGVLQFQTLGILPGTLGTYPHSPNSGAVTNEPAPQFLGKTAYLLFPNGVTKLEFIDWPRTIGIDNLTVDPPTVPAPGSLVLMLVGLLGVALYPWRSGKGA